MKMRHCVLGLALVAGAAWAAQPTTRPEKSAEIRPIATIKSSVGLVVNGVPTPPGVNSALVAPGDVINTLGGPATMRYTDGRTVTISPAVRFRVPPRSGAPIVVTPSPIHSRTIVLSTMDDQ